MGSELVLQDLASFFITSPGLDDGAGASDDTTSLSFLVVLALTNPFSELELAFDFEERDSVVLAEGTDELLVGGFFTGSSEDAEVSGTPKEIDIVRFPYKVSYLSRSLTHWWSPRETPSTTAAERRARFKANWTSMEGASLEKTGYHLIRE